MRNAFAACTALLLWSLSALPAQAQFCFVPCCVSYEWRPVVCYRPEWREERVPCVVQRVNYRSEVTRVNVPCWTLKHFDERVRTSYYVPVPREVEREVRRCVMVPVVTVDPCTGCCFVSSYPHWISERVRCIEYDYRREERDVDVKVCRWVQENRVVDQVRWIPEVAQVQSWTVRRYCVMVPYQTWVCVPVCH